MHVVHVTKRHINFYHISNCQCQTSTCRENCRRSTNVLNTIGSSIKQFSTKNKNWRRTTLDPGGHQEECSRPSVQQQRKPDNLAKTVTRHEQLLTTWQVVRHSVSAASKAKQHYWALRWNNCLGTPMTWALHFTTKLYCRAVLDNNSNKRRL